MLSEVKPVHEIRSFNEIGFRVEITGDGSPTLRLENQTSTGESMHHSGGAVSESEMIYAAPINGVLHKIQDRPIVASVVGLGLGYIELIWAREMIRRGKTAQQQILYSYESVTALSELFLSFVTDGVLQSEIQAVYELVLHFICSNPIEQKEVKKFLAQAYRQNCWKLQGELVASINHNQIPAHFIFYDAFSAKTNVFLWQEEFLETFLAKLAQPNFCVFTTYACRASLKKALSKSNFEVEVREGFMGKRNSTLARRF